MQKSFIASIFWPNFNNKTKLKAARFSATSTKTTEKLQHRQSPGLYRSSFAKSQPSMVDWLKGIKKIWPKIFLSRKGLKLRKNWSNHFFDTMTPFGQFDQKNSLRNSLKWQESCLWGSWFFIPNNQPLVCIVAGLCSHFKMLNSFLVYRDCDIPCSTSSFLSISFFAIEYFLFLHQIVPSRSKQWNKEWTNMHTNDQSCFISQSGSSSAFGFRESLLRSKGRGILVGEFGFCFRKDRSIWVFESYCRSNSRKWALTWT